MSTSYPFIITPRRPFQFKPMLDKKLYVGIITWNVFGQRWYLSIIGNNNTRIFTRPLIESSPLMQLDSATYDTDTRLVTLTTSAPHNLAVGSMALLTVAGVSPTAYNGLYEMAVQSPTQLSYPLIDNPGGVALIGSVGRLVNMAYGYFKSTIIYQNGNITVSP